MNFYAIIPAAGEGKRFGGKKQEAVLKGKTLIDHCEQVFAGTKIFEKIVVVGRDISGGKTRAESVFNGFKALALQDDDVVLIHDAARPLVSPALIMKVAEETKKRKAVIPVIAVNDTMKEIRDGVVFRTVNRNSLVSVQTPQGFLAKLLRGAYQSVDLNDARWTDEAAIIESVGQKVHVVEGERRNIKVTTAEDLKLCEWELATMCTN